MNDVTLTDISCFALSEHYSKSTELFESAIHILCSNGSHQSRLKRAYIAISEIEPAKDLPKRLFSDFYELQYNLNRDRKNSSVDVLTDTISSLNAMELSIVTSGFIRIYSELRKSSVSAS